MGDILWWSYHFGILTKSPKPAQPPTLTGVENKCWPKGRPSDALQVAGRNFWPNVQIGLRLVGKGLGLVGLGLYARLSETEVER